MRDSDFGADFGASAGAGVARTQAVRPSRLTDVGMVREGVNGKRSRTSQGPCDGP